MSVSIIIAIILAIGAGAVISRRKTPQAKPVPVRIRQPGYRRPPYYDR